MKELFSIILFVFCFNSISAQTNWTLINNTYASGAISGTITQGYIFKINRAFYIVTERTRQRVRTRSPKVKIYQKNSDYKLVIEDFEEPVICKKLKNVIETQISGEFKGWDGKTIFKMMNGQIWQQAAYAYMYHYAYMPSVLIYEYKGVWKMKVENVDEVLEVSKLR